MREQRAEGCWRDAGHCLVGSLKDALSGDRFNMMNFDLTLMNFRINVVNVCLFKVLIQDVVSHR